MERQERNIYCINIDDTYENDYSEQNGYSGKYAEVNGCTHSGHINGHQNGHTYGISNGHLSSNGHIDDETFHKNELEINGHFADRKNGFVSKPKHFNSLPGNNKDFPGNGHIDYNNTEMKIRQIKNGLKKGIDGLTTIHVNGHSANGRTINGQAENLAESYPMKFYMNELKNLNKKSSKEFVGKSVIDGEYHDSSVAITSSSGSVRGVRNRVRAGIETFKTIGQETRKKNFQVLEQEKVVVYTTSLRVRRKTFEQCEKVRNIFRTLMVRFEERDLCVNEEAQMELKERLLLDQQPEIPQVFVNGDYVGDAEKVQELNEAGILRHMLKDFQKVVATTSCDQCGGFGFLPCFACNGSKKSMHRNHFTEEFQALRCTMCDDNGLVRCESCLN